MGLFESLCREQPVPAPDHATRPRAGRALHSPARAAASTRTPGGKGSPILRRNRAMRATVLEDPEIILPQARHPPAAVFPSRCARNVDQFHADLNYTGAARGSRRVERMTIPPIGGGSQPASEIPVFMASSLLRRTPVTATKRKGDNA